MAPQFIYTMRGLTRFYPPDREVLKGINLSFYPGVKIGVIGFTPPAIMAWDKRWLDGNVYTQGLVESASKYVPEMKAKGAQIIVGFAAETENALENARQKLVGKNLDAIVVNDVSREGVGFDSDRNAVTIISRDEIVEVPETTKWEVAQRVLDQVVRLRQHRKSPVKA